MIVRVPGSNEWYNIINLYWGTLAGVYKRESKFGDTNKWVESSPAPANASSGHWSFVGIIGTGAVKYVCHELWIHDYSYWH